MATVIRHPAFTPPMPAVTRILSQFDRDKLASFIEVAIGLLDLAEGDTDIEDDNEDCCPAFDDYAATETPRSDDGSAGDPDDTEDDGDERDIAWPERLGSLVAGNMGTEDDEEDDFGEGHSLPEPTA